VYSAIYLVVLKLVYHMSPLDNKLVIFNGITLNLYDKNALEVVNSFASNCHTLGNSNYIVVAFADELDYDEAINTIAYLVTPYAPDEYYLEKEIEDALIENRRK
jgi:hypothetical protein